MAMRTSRVLVGGTIASLAAVVCSVTAVAAQAGASSRAVDAPAPTLTPEAGSAPPGTNLVVNSGAEAGAGSQSGYDMVTVPGWAISSGMPTVVDYGGIPGSHVPAAFPSLHSPGPFDKGDAFFAGGAGGTSVLSQTFTIHPPRGNVHFVLSAWLGGSGARSDAASFSVVFRSRTGKVLSSTTVGPVTRLIRHNQTGLLRELASALVPVGAAQAEVVLTMDTSNTRYDTVQSSVVGYNYAFADNLSLSFSAIEPRPELAPPRAPVPRFQHVFLTVMENESYSDIIGNVSQAPFINSLLPSGSVLTDIYAEVHPSDPNYLALSGGRTFGILGNPLESDPTMTIPARNIADLIESSNQTWKGYAQSADGPCDKTDHGYYYLDDLPFLYYRDIQDNAARCRAHLVPQSQLAADLASPASTPSFSWIDANDYYDMEQGGVRAGDQWLRQLVTEIRHSPAWRDQSSLLIITWDEDHWDGQRPAQLIPTIVLGSQFVKAGYASTNRYTHYSLLRTIESALGLPTLTANDRYAPALDDVFKP